MKTLLLEILLVVEAVALWAFALPIAAILFGFSLVWTKAAGWISHEPVRAAGPRLARVSG